MKSYFRKMLHQRNLSATPFGVFTNLIFLLSAIFAIFPIVFATGQMNLSFTLVIYSTFLNFIKVYFDVNLNIIHIPRCDPDSVSTLMQIVYGLYCVQPIVYFFVSVFNTRRLSNIRHSLTSVDSSLRDFEETDHGWLKEATYLILLLLKFIEFCIPYLAANVKFLAIGNIVYILGCAQYTAIGLELNFRFRRLALCLRQTKEKANQNVQAEQIVTLSKAHNQLCSAAEEFSICYSFQILYIILINFFCLTLVFFGILFFKNGLMDIHNMNLLYMTVPIIMAIDCSAELMEQSKEINILLYQLMIKDGTNQLINNERLRLNISMKREVVLTVCGLFNYDYTLLHSILAAITTYLVVMFQFIE